MKLLNSFVTSITFVAVFVAAFSALASGGWFAVTSEDTELGEPIEVAADEPPQYRVKLEHGKSLTLIAQGVVASRGGKPEPFEPDAGDWSYDESRFQRLDHDTKKYDKTMVPVRLKAIKAGETRIRFSGQVLGYDRRYDVIVDVPEPEHPLRPARRGQ